MTMTDLSNKPISYTGSHPLELAYRALLARAEAAEALAYERLEDMLFAEQRATDADLRAEAAEAEAADAILAASDAAQREGNAMHALSHVRARVAELEAQLAAQQWRPVTEKPEKPGWYVVYDSDGHVFYNAEIFPYRVARWTGKFGIAPLMG
jgi:GNAT superfamily N-acetyltransferase